MNKTHVNTHNSIPKNRVEKKYHRNGKIWSETLYANANGKRHGMETYWDESGQKMVDTMYKNGKKHGVENGWYEDGTKQYEEMWVNGKKHGLENGWNEDGTKRYEEMWLNDKKQGMDTWWYEGRGKEKKWEIYYITGGEQALMEWNENGNVTKADFQNLIPKKTNKQRPQKFPTTPPLCKQLREISQKN